MGIALAVFDMLFLLLSIAESVRRNFQEREGNGTELGGLVTQYHHHLFPYFLFPFHSILLTSSIFMTISISIERYLVIFHHNYYKNRSCFCTLICHIIPVIFFAVLINIPVFFSSKVVVEDGLTRIDVTELRLSYEYSVYYQHWTRFLVLGVLPLILLTLLNLRIFLKIRRSNNRSDFTYFIITLLIVIIFIFCHLPRLALNFYEAVHSEYIGMCGPSVWSLIFHVFSNSLLPVINSTSNFFVYILAGGNTFRQSLIGVLRCDKDNRKEFTEEYDEVKEVTEMGELEQTKLLRL